jgi:hypothetical protein
MDSDEKIKSIYEEAFQSMVSKRKSYGTTSKPCRCIELSKGLSLEPWKNSFLRMMDKLSVIYAYLKDENYKHDESLRENLVDAVNYGIISIFFMDIDNDGYNYSSVDDLLNDIRKVIQEKGE